MQCSCNSKAGLTVMEREVATIRNSGKLAENSIRVRTSDKRWWALHQKVPVVSFPRQARQPVRR